MKECKDCFHYECCGYHITEETDMSVNECANTFVDAENVVEVVRCKDCVYASRFSVIEDLHECRFYRDVRKATDYCNYGKRKLH